jgi:translation initiation factor 5B
MTSITNNIKVGSNSTDPLYTQPSEKMATTIENDIVGSNSTDNFIITDIDDTVTINNDLNETIIEVVTGEQNDGIEEKNKENKGNKGNKGNNKSKTAKVNLGRGFCTTSTISKSSVAVLEKDIPIIPTVPHCKRILAIMGHVDTGKTSFIGALSQKNVTEAGNITQQVGTKTFRREDTIKYIPRNLQEKYNIDFVTIDTPGHTAFENIRIMGNAMSHFTLVMIDIVKGIDSDTMDFLRENIKTSADYKKTVLVLNKIDRITDYKTVGYGNLKKVLSNQSEFTKELLERYYTNIIIKLSENELYGEPYYRKRQTDCLAMIPISAKTGDGIPDLLLYLSNINVSISNVSENRGFIIDKRNDSKYGKILVGIMKYGTICKTKSVKIGDSYFPIKQLLHFGHTDSRAGRLEPIISVGEATAFAITVDISHYDIIEIGSKFDISDHVVSTVDETLFDNFSVRKSKILSDHGVYVIVPSESMIEGIQRHLATNAIPLASYSVGSMNKQDFIKFARKFDHQTTEYYNRFKSILICIPDMTDECSNDVLLKRFFDEDRIKLLKHENISVFFGGTIFTLTNDYMRFFNNHRQLYANKYIQYMPYEVETLPKHIFRVSGPILCGVRVKSGMIAVGSGVYDNSGTFYGNVSGIQLNKKDINVASIGMEVCIKIEGTSSSLIKTNNYVFKNQNHFSSNYVSSDVKFVNKL